MGKRQGPAALQDADATVPRASEVAIDRGPDESGPLSDFAPALEAVVAIDRKVIDARPSQ